MAQTGGPDQRPSFLVAALGTFAKNRFTDLLAPVGIAPQHFGVLRWLAGADGSTQQEIADLMQIRRNVMVGLVDDLEHAGLVVRRRHPVDRRANALHLTAVGRRTFARAERLAGQLDEELLDPVEPAHRAAFLSALHQLGVATGIDTGVFPELRPQAHPPPAHQQA